MASSIQQLIWIQDGIDDKEAEAIQNLLYIAVVSRTVASSVVSLGWMQDSIDNMEAEAIHWMNNIGDVEVASAVVSLGWVEDGIREIEVKALEEISYIAHRSAEVASSVVSMGWVQDGINAVEAEAIVWVGNIKSVEVASAVVSLGWVEDGIREIEVKALEEISYIAHRSAEVASSVVSMGWVQDGINDVEAVAIVWVGNIKSVEVASAVVSLGWVEDGIREIEVKALEEISYIAHRSAEVASSVVAMGWVQDGISDVEAEAIVWMGNIGSVQVASAVVSLGWVEDGIRAIEVKALEKISYIDYRSAEVASSVVAMGWVQDGISDVEAEAIVWMGNIGSVQVASAVVSLGWVEDGIREIEVKALEKISYIDYRSAEVASSVVAMSWVQDGIGDPEAELDLIGDIASIANEDAEAALRIVGMPFMETIEPPDKSAIASLRQLAADDPAAFASVMSLTALRDGISNDQAAVVATLNGVTGTNPGLIDVLLDPSRILLEQRTITLPVSGDVTLAIIRTSTGAARSMDLLEHSVRGAEEYMRSPLPTSYVGLLYENAVSGSSAGTNFGTHITILPEYDVDDGSHEASVAGQIVAHEVAHYYWSGNADWVDEGAADLMASFVDDTQTGRPIGVTNFPCAFARNIAELESLSIARGDIEFTCNYSLGERLFVDLSRTLGEGRFRQGFRELYLASEIEGDADNLRGTSVGIEHIVEAFRSDDGTESVVIARWYDGTEPYDLSHLDTGPVNPSLNSINGRIDEALVTVSEDGPAVSTFSAQEATAGVYVTLKYSYDVSGDPHELPLEIVEYYEDGFEFRRQTISLPAEAQYIGGTLRFSIGSPPSRKWALGHYVVFVYAGEHKVAEVEYEVTP